MRLLRGRLQIPLLPSLSARIVAREAQGLEERRMILCGVVLR